MHLNLIIPGVLIGAQLVINLFLAAHIGAIRFTQQSHRDWLDADAELLDHHLDRIHHLEGQVSEHEGRLNLMTPLKPTA